MVSKHTVLGVTAALALYWRASDPIESYAALFSVTNWLTNIFMDHELLSNSLNMLLLDQFNGILIGLVLASILHIVISTAKNSAKVFATKKVK